MSFTGHIFFQFLLLGIVIVILIKWFFIIGILCAAAFTSYLKKNRYVSQPNQFWKHEQDPFPKNESSRRKLFRKIAVYETGISNYAAFLLGQIPSYFLRKFGCKIILKMEIAQNVIIARNLEIRSGYKIKIGANSIIGDSCTLDGRSGLTIGNNVNLSSNVKIWTLQHNLNSLEFSVEGENKPVIIHDRVWISSNVTILPGVEIGKGAVVAAGAVVTKNIEPFAVYAGVPAKKISDRIKNLTYSFDGTTPFFI